MTRRQISTPHAPKAIGPYSQAVLVDGWLYCSGQIPVDPATGTVVADGLDEDCARRQTVRVLENLRAVLAAAAMTPADVVRCTVYLADISHFVGVNTEYAKFFGTENPPARATVEVSRRPKSVLVEIDCIARA